MQTLKISISQKELNQFAIEKNNLSFSEVIELVKRELFRQNMIESIQLAEKYGLSTMTMSEIDQEVKAVRNGKSHN